MVVFRIGIGLALFEPASSSNSSYHSSKRDNLFVLHWSGWPTNHSPKAKEKAMKQRNLILPLIALIILMFALPAYAVFCFKCGTQNPDNAVYCSKCGTELYHPAESVDIYKQSSDLIEGERFDEAISLLEPQYASNLLDTRAKVLLAEAYLGKCDLLKANGDEQYRTLVLKPYKIGESLLYSADGYYICAYSFLITDRTGRAAKYIKKAIKMSPPDSRYYLIWGNARAVLALDNNDKGKYATAKKTFQKIIKMNAPKDYKALSYYWLGTLYAKFENKAKAMEALSAALDYAEKKSTRTKIKKQLASIASYSGRESAALRLERLKREKEKQKLAYIPKTETSAKLSLRKESKKMLSEDAVMTMLENHDLFDSEWNPNGSFDNEFVDNGDGTVTDKTTGLMWQKDGSPKPLTLKRATRYIRKINDKRFLGYSDWRMPTIEELASTITRSASSGLHINPIFAKKQEICWSSDSGHVEDKYMKDVWIANFAKGRVALYMIEDRQHLIGDYMETFYVKGVRSAR
jgi:tetratricopeptide (TPR) repeat protein